MPWKETNVIEERMKFIATIKNGEWAFADVCRDFGISRKTGYKYLRNYKAEGIDGLKEKPRVRKTQSKATNENTVRLIVEMREAHPSWGPKKIVWSLQAKYHRQKSWPSKTTIGNILRKKGLVKVKRKRQRTPTSLFPFSNVNLPNDVWCVDFKGNFTVGNGQRCDPLTITDAHSRYLLGCEILDKSNTEQTKRIFERVFKEYGLPNAIKSDNGAPFASRAIGGLSELSVWWLRLGIRPERIEPGKPQQNGRHERMHRTLKQETALPARSSLEEQQRAFDEFKMEYNFVRPHEALKNKFPTEYYRKSSRTFPDSIPLASYPTNIMLSEVNDLGNIHCEGHRVFLSSALADEVVGLEEISERHLRIIFHNAALGVIDTYTGKVLQYKNPMLFSIPSDS